MIEIIPAIDVIDGRIVRLQQGDYGKVTGYDTDPVDMVKRYADYGFKRIHVVDLDGAKNSSSVNLKALEMMANISDVNIEWGGGIKSDSALKDAFNAGASYVCAGSIAVWKPELFKNWLVNYGSERIILGADVREREIAVKGWTEMADLTIDELIDSFLPHSLSQVIVTDISRDGMLQGPNFALYEDLKEKFPQLVITVSGGISSLADIEMAEEKKLQRVIVGKAIYENKIDLKQLSKFND